MTLFPDELRIGACISIINVKALVNWQYISYLWTTLKYYQIKFYPDFK